MSISYSEKERTKNGNIGEPVAILSEVLRESLVSFRYFVMKNLGSIGIVFQILIPYICMMGLYATGYHFIWIVIPLLMFYMAYILKRVNMVYNNRTADNIPIPYKRFTDTDTDGVVFIESDRLQELLLYMEELEDKLESMGKL